MPEEITENTEPVETPEAEETPYIEEEPTYSQPEETESPQPAEDEVPFEEKHYKVGAKFGLTPDQVDAFGDVKLYEGALGRLEAIARSAAQVQNTKPAEETTTSDDTFSDFQFSDPNEYDPEIVNLTEQTNRRFASLEQKMDEVMSNSHLAQQDSAKQQAEQNVASFEKAVNQLDEDTFGRGSFDSVSSQHSDNRMKLAKSVSRLAHGYSARGEDVPSVDELVEESISGSFSEELGNQTLKTAASESRRQRGQTIAAPTRDQPSEKTSTEAAIQAATDWFRENEKR